MEQVKIWFITPESESIVVKTLPKNYELKDIKNLLDCKMIEYQGFTAPDGNCYAIYMDEEGMYSNKKHNKTAKKLLSKIKGLMWGSFIGNYMVFSYRNENYDEVNRDMDITPKEFVEKFNNALRK